MTLTRRQFLGGSGALTGLGLLGPVVARTGLGLAQAAVDPATALRNRLVIIVQSGGNDGLNMVIPTGDVPGAPRYSVYRKVRPSIGYDRAVALPLDRPGDADWAIGLNPKLPTLHSLYRADRMAVVQGVDYPNHNYSHFVSMDIWDSGLPELSNDSGWIGRHLDRAGIGDGELRAVGIGYELPLLLRGRASQGVEIASLPLRFADGTEAIGDRRHAAFKSFGQPVWSEPLRQYAGDQAEITVGTVETLEAAPAVPTTPNYLANSLLNARTLLTENLGVEVVVVYQYGYDTHTAQVPGQEALFTQLDEAIGAFLFGKLGATDLGIGELDQVVAERTLIITVSEFGRRIGENGGANVSGTDHGAAAPMLMIGPGVAGATGHALVPGVHGDHPNMGTTLAPADNLTMTTDLRTVYQALLENWLNDTEPGYGTSYPALPGLFT
jgi:uncharacterized protein (DUF1501 family)